MDAVKKKVNAPHYDTSIKPEYHEIANKEPMMSQIEMGGLVELMKKNKFDEDQPVWIYEGKILDGRNRTVAAKAAGVKVITKTFTGTYEEAEDKSIMLNNRRRHKSAGQKAMAAAYALKANKESRSIIEADTLKANPTIGKRKLMNIIRHKCPLLSNEGAAKQQGCSKTNVTNANSLLENDTDLAEKVFSGEHTLTQAMNLYQKILNIRKTKTANDGDYNPEEIQKFQEMDIIKLDPEGAYLKLQDKDNQLEQLQAEKEQSIKVLMEHIKLLEDELKTKDLLLKDFVTE